MQWSIYIHLTVLYVGTGAGLQVYYIYSSKESYGEIMAEEVYIASGSHPSTRS